VPAVAAAWILNPHNTLQPLHPSLYAGTPAPLAAFWVISPATAPHSPSSRALPRTCANSLLPFPCSPPLGCPQAFPGSSIGPRRIPCPCDRQRGRGGQAAAGPERQPAAEGGTAAASSLSLSPPAGAATGQIPASPMSRVPEGLCGCLGSSRVADSCSHVHPGRARPDGRLRGSRVSKEPGSRIMAIWLVAP